VKYGTGVLRWSAIVFDLDGTLIDTIPLILASHRYALNAVLGVSIPDEQLRAGIGRPLIDQMRSIDADRADELHSVYLQWNHAQTERYLRWFDGIDQLLCGLAGDDARIGIVTSKMRDAVDLAFRLAPPPVPFGVVVTLDDTDRHKPEPAPLLHALGLLGVSAGDAVYVGDAPHDLVAARRAGCAAVGVTWGVATRALLEAQAPEAVVDDPRQLADVLYRAG
jgi:pyrophosphatase PpaX